MAEEEASLAITPTWVVAAVCFAIVSVSLVTERFLHYLGKASAGTYGLFVIFFLLLNINDHIILANLNQRLVRGNDLLLRVYDMYQYQCSHRVHCGYVHELPFALFLNAGWHTYFWLAFLPLFLLLIAGAKLEHIVTRLAQEAASSLSNETTERALKLRALKLKPSKEHFWFGKPGHVLHLIHFILFQNSFEIGFFFWVVVSEGFSSCMMERKVFAISRLVIGVIIEVICSYITLPLYAIVTHMAGDIKLQGIGSGLHESVQSWATGARMKQTMKETGDDPVPDPGAEVVDENGRFGSSRSMLTAAPSPPSLDEIVAVEDGHHGQGRDNLGR